MALIKLLMVDDDEVALFTLGAPASGAGLRCNHCIQRT
jgi:hypothetical protein